MSTKRKYSAELEKDKLITFEKPLQKNSVRLGLAVLLTIAAAVFFWLPEQVEKPEVDPSQAFSEQASKSIRINNRPWLDGQLARQKKAAREVLADLLDLQFSLEKKSAPSWAKDEFTTVAEIATGGDEAYGREAFTEATELYQTGLDKLRQIDARSETVQKQLMESGVNHYQNNRVESAIEVFDLALAIKPDDQENQEWRRRAGVLNKVMKLQQQAETQYKQGAPNQALMSINIALGLDGKNSHSLGLRDTYQQAIDTQRFKAAMSRGYEALLNQNLQNAKSAFEEAAAINPNAADAAAALRETANQQTLAQISRIATQATTLEYEEKWQQASELYRRALKLDSSLIFAQVGAIRTEIRQQLDQAIESYLQQPQRLNNETVYAEARRILTDARNIKNPGSKLTKQMAQLEQALTTASQTLPITLRSDNQTKVRINRVGDFGSFYSQQLLLKPGSYVAIGSKPGYRDVRIEFSISSNEPLTDITVSCTVPI